MSVRLKATSRVAGAFRELVALRFATQRNEVAMIASSGLFDENWYRERHLIHAEGLEPAIEHYVRVGASTNARPHPLFDVAWYAGRYLSSGNNSLTPLGHYIKFGRRGGATPNPLFDPLWYIERASVGGVLNIDPFVHFLREGGTAGLSPHPLFDSELYLGQAAKLATGRINPLTHFVECGAQEGLWPNRFFDVSWYLNEYREVHATGQNPLAHFILEGAEKGYLPHPNLNLQSLMVTIETLPRTALEAFVSIVQGKCLEIDVSSFGPGKTVKSAPARHSHVDDANFARVMGDLQLDGYQPVLHKDDFLPSIQSDKVVEPIEIPNGIAVVSFDVWDTVLRRNCHPDEIKLQSARSLLLKSYSFLKPAYRDLRTLFRARLLAEEAAAPNSDHEYRFDVAIDIWLTNVTERGTEQSKLGELKSALLKHEFSAEKKCTRLDSNMLSRMATATAKITKIFASDFYMSATFIDELLGENGGGGQFVKGYASSDLYKTKRSGELFDRIISDFRLKPAELFHIGDNDQADVAIPRSKGINTFLYTSEAEQNRRDWYARAWSEWQKGSLTSHWRRLLAELEQLAGNLDDSSPEGSLRAIGARLSPLVVGYVLSILEDGIKEGVDTVFFFTREGQFFQQVYDRLTALDPYNVKSPKSALLEVSRRATFAASLNAASPAELMRLWNLYSTQSIKGLAVSLNLDQELVAREAARFDLDYDAPIQYPWTNQQVRKLLASPDFLDHVQSRLREQRNLAAGYFEQMGFSREKLCVVADIGWRGTIQDNIALICPKTFVRGHYIGLFKYLNSQPSNVVKLGWAFDHNDDIAVEVSEVAALEVLFTASGGSVQEYAEHGGRISAIRTQVDEEENIILGKVAEVQAGVLAAVATIAEYVSRHGLLAADLHPMGVAVLRALCERPPSALADLFFEFHHNETFGTGDVDAMSNRGDALLDALQSAADVERYAAVTDALDAGRWLSGAVRRSDIQTWWHNATNAERTTVPTDLYVAQAPALIGATGSRLSVFVPPPLRSSGGHRTIFNVVRRLANVGFAPHIFLEGIGAGVPVVEEYLKGTPAVIHTQWHKHIPSQVALATIAHSAEFVAGLTENHFGTYLVQDFEAQFNPMSDAYVVAENSYTHGLHHFTIGNWLTHVIRRTYGAKAFPAGLGVDTETYRILPSASRERAVCFLYQPDKPRRTPILGIDALRLVRAAIPDVKIIVFGSDLPIHLDFDVENLGLITSLEELNALYNRCAVGLCISGSNPSRIPYEMMAAGCVPVDLYRYNNLLDHREGTISLAYQNSASLAQAMIEILTDGRKAQTMSKSGATYVEKRTLKWEVDLIANYTLAMMNGQLDGEWSRNAIYSSAPVIAEGVESTFARRFCETQLSVAQS